MIKLSDHDVWLEVAQIHRRINEGRVQRSALMGDYLDMILRRAADIPAAKTMAEDIRAHIKGPGA